MPKPILILFFNNKMFTDRVSHDITVKFLEKKLGQDYYTLLVPKPSVEDFEFQVLNPEKELTTVQYDELKKIITDAIAESRPSN